MLFCKKKKIFEKTETIQEKEKNINVNINKVFPVNCCHTSKMKPESQPITAVANLTRRFDNVQKGGWVEWRKDSPLKYKYKLCIMYGVHVSYLVLIYVPFTNYWPYLVKKTIEFCRIAYMRYSIDLCGSSNIFASYGLCNGVAVYTYPK